MTNIPTNFYSLHKGEEELRRKALSLINEDSKLLLHMKIIEEAMNLSDLLRTYSSDDEDFKVIQIFGMRIFNAFGASLKLVLSGYTQNGAIILRDILETVFLLDLFGDQSLIAKWRFADKKTTRELFSPAAVRKALDSRYGHTGKKREELYKLFSELAGHPTMKSSWMMRPQKDGDAFIGPFIEKATLAATLFEMGRLAFQVGKHLYPFFPKDWKGSYSQLLAFTGAANDWWAEYPTATVR